MLSQKEAVYTAVSKVLESKGKTVNPNAPLVLSDEENSQVQAVLLLLFTTNKVKLTKKSQEKYTKVGPDLYRYIKTLLSNWLSRDPRFLGKPEEANRKVSVEHELLYIKSKLSDPNEIQAIDNVLHKHINLSLIPSNVMENSDA